MELERQYYEIESFWSSDGPSAGDLERAKVTCSCVPAKTRRILDVGCGNGFVADYMLEHFSGSLEILCADRSAAALKYCKGIKLQLAIQQLPFPNASFDLVMALEIIEHLPVRIFDMALSEICRVSARHVMVSVPYMQDLDSSLVVCHRCRTHFNPDYHMDQFDNDRMKGLLEGHGFSCLRLIHIGRSVRLRMIRHFYRMGLLKRDTCNPFPFSIPCPQCGHLLPGTPNSLEKSVSSKPANSLRTGVKRLWPKQVVPSKILGLYERSSP
jgi:SAM-dependent methyltransferase